MDIKFDLILVDDKLVKNIKTPAILEANILKQYPIKSGDFVVLEWEKFTEDILVTSERSALISSQTCKKLIFLLISSHSFGKNNTKFIELSILAATQIYRVLMTWIYREHKIRTVIQTTNTVKLLSNKEAIQRNMYTSTPPQAKYDILVSVFNPRPDQQRVTWNVQSAIESM